MVKRDEDIQKKINRHKQSMNNKLSKDDKIKIISEDKPLLEHLTNKGIIKRAEGLPEDQWIELPEGKSIIEHYNEKKQKDGENEREKGR
ncbi:hypothetical protein [Mesobacillus maritimus]|uniref:hypothetical protein n=1 Tax=Mesobacillus maritimus TaxID=1643336 RepID=UPI00384A8C1E